MFVALSNHTADNHAHDGAHNDRADAPTARTGVVGSLAGGNRSPGGQLDRRQRQAVLNRVETIHTNAPAEVTLATLSRVAREAAREWTVRQWAGRLAAQAAPHDYRGQLRAVFQDLVQRRWRYVQEPDEYIHGTPASLLGHVLGCAYNRGPRCPDPLHCDVLGTRWRARGWGDCDDVAALVAAACMALGCRVRWRIARSPSGAHIAVQATTPAGDVVDIDPVAWPRLGRGPGRVAGFGWGLTGPGVEVQLRELEDGGDGMLAGVHHNRVGRDEPATRRGRRRHHHDEPATRGLDRRRAHHDHNRGCHWCAVPPHDRGGPRILAVPGWHAKQFGRGVVVDGTPAADQYGQHYLYHAGLDLFVPEASEGFGSLRSWWRGRFKRRARRRARAKRFFRKIGAGLRKFGRGVVRVAKRVGKVVRKIGALVLSSKIIQRIIGGALRVVGIPALLTRTLLGAIGAIMKEGGILKLIKLARKDPRAALRVIAKGIGLAGRFDLLKKIKGFFSGFGSVDGGPCVMQQNGSTFHAAPVAAMVGFDGIQPSDEIVVADDPTSGRWYRGKPGESFLEVVGKAYGVGPGGARLERAKWVVAAAANEGQLAAPRSDFERQHFPAGLPRWAPATACDPAAALAGQPGKCYPLVWFPPAKGIEPPQTPRVDAADDGSQGQWPTPPPEIPGEPVELPPDDDDDGPPVVEVPPDNEPPNAAPPVEAQPAPEYPITPRPTKGARYRVRGGDTLLGIAGAAAGVGPGAARLAFAQIIASHPFNQGAVRPPANEFERNNFPAGLPSLMPRYSCSDSTNASPGGKCLPLLYIPTGPADRPGGGTGGTDHRPTDPREEPKDQEAKSGGGLAAALLLLPFLMAK